MEKDYLQGQPVETIYFGGGTPSLLRIDEIQSILNMIRKHFHVIDDAEITLEANPDDINETVLLNWKAAGINRLSIGVQSFFEEELRWMNRAHNAKQAIANLQLARRHFDNITMDLIYGSPLLTDAMWQQNVATAIQLSIPHLSCYALTVEEKTPLNKMIEASTAPAVDADRQASQFLLLMQWLQEAGYEHYEVSNFAKRGFRSRHNSAYWKGKPYLGLGPSAHSYNGQARRSNIANNNQYITGINDRNPAREEEQLTPSQQLNEFIMISLRTMEGIDLDHVEEQWGLAQRNRIEFALAKFSAAGLVRTDGKQLQLTNEGMLRADGIASALFV